MSNNTPTKDQLAKLLSFLQNNNKKVFSTVLRAFLLAILILSIFTSVSLWKKLQKKDSGYKLLNEKVSSQKEQIESLQNQIYKSDQLLSNLNEIVLNQYDILEFLQTTNLSSINLKNYQNNLVVQGKIFLDKPNKKAVLIAKDLDILPEGHTYQLWAVFKINPTSIGTFNTDDSGSAVMKIEYVPNPQKIKRFIVTKELGSGSSEPTGDMYLLGSL
jgi:hypothetical protein